MSLWPELENGLRDSDQSFDTPEYKQFFSVELTPARQAVWICTTRIHKSGAIAGEPPP